MENTFLFLSIAGLALTVNAWRPLRHIWLTIPVFFAGWLTSELAPVLLIGHLVGLGWFIGAGAVSGLAGWVGLACSLGTALGLALIVRESLRVRVVLEDALAAGLGDDYLERAGGSYHLRPPLRTVLLPFWLWDRAVRRHRGLRYGDHGMRNRLDVYVPRAAVSAPRPVLVYVHGGGWTPVSNKNHQGKPLMLHMAARGWVCVAPNYRVSPRVAFPEHLVDVKRALAWVQANISTYGGDPSMVVIAGGSAGAHLASLAALTAADHAYQPGFEDVDLSVRACVPHYGVYDLTDDAGTKMAAMRLRFLERYMMKTTLASDRAAFESGSPHHRVGAEAPPFFVIHGANDSLAPVEEARAFVTRLREVSRAPVAYAELDRTQHAFDVFHSIRSAHVVRAIERFCDWVVAEARAAR